MQAGRARQAEGYEVEDEGEDEREDSHGNFQVCSAPN